MRGHCPTLSLPIRTHMMPRLTRVLCFAAIAAQAFPKKAKAYTYTLSQELGVSPCFVCYTLLLLRQIY